MLKPRPRSLALLARAIRHSQMGPSHPTYLRMPNSYHNSIDIHRGLSFVPQDRLDGKQKLKTVPSFAIAAAFEGHEDVKEENDDLNTWYGHNDNFEDPTVERERALSEQFRRGIEKKLLWMQSLATQKLYAAIVKCVADCYAPLYSVMGLEGKCPLLVVARNEAKGEHDLETEYQPLRFDDMLTKFTEQEALALLVTSKQPMMALAIVEHRNKLAQELVRRSEAGVGVVLPCTNVMKDENVVILDRHFRMFYSWAMSAYSLCGQDYYQKVFDMYKQAQEAGIYVTANMNVQYLSVLIAQKRFDQVFNFYESITRDNLPSSVFFYRQLLLAVSMTHKIELLDAVLEDMRVKGFKLRAVDYLRAICTYDNEYYFRPRINRQRSRYEGRKEEAEVVLAIPKDSYDMCSKRIWDQENYPEQEDKLFEAAQNVLALFDAMVDIDGLEPREVYLFPRVITAAVCANECERVPELLALHDKYADAPLHDAGVRMAVNAFLLLDKYEEAWEFIRATNSHLYPHRFALVANIFNYLCKKKRGKDILALMRNVDKLDLRGVFTLSLIKKLIPALCSSLESVGDDDLLAIMAQFDAVFRLSKSEHSLNVFLRECCHNRRLAVVKAMLKLWLTTSNNQRPLKGAVGLKLLETFESESEWKFMAEVFEMIDFSQAKNEDHRKAILDYISRAYDALGQSGRVKRAQHILTITETRQKQGHHRSTKQQKKGVSRRSNRLKTIRNVPVDSRAKTLHGIPVISSS